MTNDCNPLLCSCGRTFAGGPSCGSCLDGHSLGPARAVSLRAAINERAERLRFREGWLTAQVFKFNTDPERLALKAQIRDLETELHEVIQDLPL